MKIKIRYISFCLFLLITTNSFATSSQGNLGFKFLGFSEKGESIVYITFYEHYGRFPVSDVNAYHREYLGTYIYNFETNKNDKISKGLIPINYGDPALPFGIKDYKYDVHDKFNIKLYNKLKKKIKMLSDQGKILFNKVEIFNSKEFIELLDIYCKHGKTYFLLHLRSYQSGEYNETLLLFDLKKEKAVIIPLGFDENLEKFF